MDSPTKTDASLFTSTSTTLKLSTPTQGGRDPDYDWQPPLKDEPQVKRGRQCGECGLKFDYDKSYGYHCSHYKCPMGYGGF